MKYPILFGLLNCCLVTFALAQGGSPDTSFGDNGFTRWDNDSKTDAFYNMALSNSGNIYLSGYTTNGTNKSPAVIQLDANGQQNKFFGDAGILILEPGGTEGEVEDIAVSGEKLYIAYYTAINDDFSSGITKYDETGKLDTTFGEAGFKTINYNLESYTPRAISVENEENVFVLATRGGKFVVAKMDNNGNEDSSFGDNGVFFYNFGAGFANVRDISLQPDNKILIVGENFISSGSNPGSNLVIFRLTTAGNLDETFNETGLKTIHYSTEITFTGEKIMWLEQEEKVMIIGAQYSGIFDGLVLKLNSDGTNDGSFGNNGIVVVEEVFQPLYGGFRDLQGRFVVAGDDYVIRLTATGEKDVSFGTNEIISDNYNIYAAELDAEGNYLVAGSYYNGNDLDGFVAKYFAENISSSTDEVQSQLVSLVTSPNPFIDNLTIFISNQENLLSGNILIQNMEGKVVYRSFILDIRCGDNMFVINGKLAELPPQPYVLSMVTENGIVSQKIIKL